MQRVITNVPGLQDTTERLVIMRRMAYAEEVAKTTVFLVSDRASFVTDLPLVIDIGLTTTCYFSGSTALFDLVKTRILSRQRC